MTLDKFGISMLAPSVPDGRYWLNRWAEFGPRTWQALGLEDRSIDPFDNQTYLHCLPGYDEFTNKCTIDGNGIMRMEGPFPRFYVNNDVDWWENVEITCYCNKILSQAKPDTGTDEFEDDTRQIETPLILCGRTDHDNDVICPCDAHGYHTQLTINDKLMIRKELADSVFATDIVDTSGVHFDGVNDYINLGVQSGLWSNTALAKFSFSFWIRPEIIYDGVNFREVVSRGWGGNYGFDLYYYTTLPRLYFEVANAVWPARVSTVYSTAPVNPYQWYHITVVYDSTLGSQISKIYVDGLLSTTQVTDVTGVTLNNTSTMTLGGVGGIDVQGNIKDFRWFQGVALTSSQALAIRNGAITPTPSYWLKMDEGTGNPTDSIGGSLTGTLTNGAAWATFPTGWVGMKLIIRNCNDGQNVDIRVYKDLTNGINGGNWVPALNTVDIGSWTGVYAKDLTKCLGQPTGCRRPTQSATKIFLSGGRSCFLGSDNYMCDFKNFSIREVKPLA